MTISKKMSAAPYRIRCTGLRFPTLVSSWARTSYGSETILMDLPQFACQVWLHECEVATAFE